MTTFVRSLIVNEVLIDWEVVDACNLSRCAFRLFRSGEGLVKQKTQCSGRRHNVLFPFLPILDHSTANGKVSLQGLYGDE